MTGITVKQPSPPASLEVTLVKLAREIAMDIHPIETILENYKISPAQWEKISTNPYFTRVLTAEIANWNAAINTQERVKVKAAAMVEEWLPEAHTRLHDPAEVLSSKTELAKLVARLADIGVNGVGVNGAGGERFSVTINMGADASLKFEKTVTPQVIEATPVEE